MGVPNASVRSEFWTDGPGSPSNLTISGAKIATRMRSTMNPAEIIDTRSCRNRRQNSESGDRALISPEASSIVSTVA